MERTDHILIKKVVLDAGPIIHLDEIDGLALLSDFGNLLVPESVWKEVLYHRPAALERENVPLCRIGPVSVKADHFLVLCNALSLDVGEREGLSLCMHHQDAVFLTDDAAARLAAKNLKIRAHGTIGILLRALRRKLINNDEALRYFELISFSSTLFIKRSLLEDIIRQVRDFRP